MPSDLPQQLQVLIPKHPEPLRHKARTAAISLKSKIPRSKLGKLSKDSGAYGSGHAGGFGTEGTWSLDHRVFFDCQCLGFSALGFGAWGFAGWAFRL